MDKVEEHPPTSIWHDASEEPEGVRCYVVINADNSISHVRPDWLSKHEIKDIYMRNIKGWAYVDELLKL